MVFQQPGDFPLLRLILRHSLRHSLHESDAHHSLQFRHLVFAAHDRDDGGDGVADDLLFATLPDRHLDCCQSEGRHLIQYFVLQNQCSTFVHIYLPLGFAAEHQKSQQPHLAVQSALHRGSGHSPAILRYHQPELLLGCFDHSADHGLGLHVALDGDALAHPIHRLLGHVLGHVLEHEFGLELEHCFPGYDRVGKALPAAHHRLTEQGATTASAYRLIVWVVSMNVGALQDRHRATLLRNHHLPVDARLVGAVVSVQPLLVLSRW